MGRDLNCRVYEAVVSSREGYQAKPTCKLWIRENRRDGRDGRIVYRVLRKGEMVGCFSTGKKKKENEQLCRIAIPTPSHVSEFDLDSHDELKQAMSILR